MIESWQIIGRMCRHSGGMCTFYSEVSSTATARRYSYVYKVRQKHRRCSQCENVLNNSALLQAVSCSPVSRKLRTCAIQKLKHLNTTVYYVKMIHKT